MTEPKSQLYYADTLKEMLILPDLRNREKEFNKILNEYLKHYGNKFTPRYKIIIECCRVCIFDKKQYSECIQDPRMEMRRLVYCGLKHDVMDELFFNKLIKKITLV